MYSDSVRSFTYDNIDKYESGPKLAFIPKATKVDTKL